MKLRNLFFIATASIMTTACNEIDDELIVHSDNILNSIQSESNRYTTRMDGVNSKWQKGDAIGVYMLKTDKSDVLNNAANVKFVTNIETDGANADFTSPTGIAISEENANFYAYYPYNGEIGADYNCTINLADQSIGYSKYDFLWASKTNVSPTDARNLSLGFSHKMAMLKIVAVHPAGITNISGVSINGVAVSGKFNVSEGIVTADAGRSSMTPYTYHKANDATSFVGILFPQENASGITMTFTTGTGDESRRFQYTLPEGALANGLKAGYQYTFSIQLGVAGGYLTSIKADISTPWDIEEVTNEGEANGVSDNEYIPVDYTQIVVASGTLTELQTKLNNAAGKVALVLQTSFNSSREDVETLPALTVPAAVSELILLGDNDEQSELYLPQGISVGTTLTRLALNNLKITGVYDRLGTTLFKADSQMATNGSIELKNSTFENMLSVIGGLTNYNDAYLKSVVIDNCEMKNLYAFAYNGCHSTDVRITNSTVYKAAKVIDVYSGPNNYYIENCTFVDISDIVFNNAGFGNTIKTYKNNISACNNTLGLLVSYKLNAETTECINSYASKEAELDSGRYSAIWWNVMGAGGANLVKIPASGDITYANWTWELNNEYDRNELFIGYTANSYNFKTNLPAGDPRWRNN